MGKVNGYLFVPSLLRPNLVKFIRITRIRYVLSHEVIIVDRYSIKLYRLRELKCNEWYYKFVSMYMYRLDVCRVSVFSKRSWNVFCQGNHSSAGSADMLRHAGFFGKDIPISDYLFILRYGDDGKGLGSREIRVGWPSERNFSSRGEF